MKLSQYANMTAAQVRNLSTADYNCLQEALENDNMHTAVVMVFAARAGNDGILKQLEILDDLHIAIGHMPMPLIELREMFRKEIKLSTLRAA